MNIIKVKSYDELSKSCAELIAGQINEKADSVLGLATGSSPIGTYHELINLYKLGKVNFSDIKTVNLDEYVGLTKDNEQSYYYFMNKNLFSHVNINKNNIYIPDGSKKDSEKECLSYEAAIKKLGGIDLQLLGLGHNGHIGFNEPDEIFPKLTHSVKLSESTIEANSRFFESPSDVPKIAYTMGIGTIFKAKKIILIAFGADKADIVKQAFYGEITPKIPASILQLHPDVTIIVDNNAGKLI